MANFFQPSVSPFKETDTATPSPEQQAAIQFRAQLLQQLLNSMAGNAPTFSSFASGGPAQRPFPANAGAGLSDVIAAMGQPGAFTSEVTRSGVPSLQSASGMNDLAQLLGLGGILYQSGLLGAGGDLLKTILAPIGGWLGIKGTNTGMGDSTPAPDFGGSQGFSGAGTGFDPGSVPGISLGDILATAQGGGGNFAFGDSGIPYSSDYLNSGLIY